MKFGIFAFDAAREAAVRNRASQFWVAIIWLLGALVVFQGLRAGVAGGITADDLGAAAEGYSSGSPVFEAAYQGARIALIGVSVFAVVFTAPLRFARPKLSLFWAGAILLTASMFLSATYGAGLGLGFPLLEMPLLLVAVWALPMPPFKVVLDSVRRVFLAIAYGSLAYFLLLPSMASQPYYGGLVPGLPVRLNGITPHANILGFAMGAYLILDMASDRKGTLVWVNRFAVLAALALSQSKTIIGVLVAVFLISVAFSGSGKRRGWFFRLLFGAAGVAAGAYIAFTGDSTLSGVGSFTGRDVIWAATLDVWQKQPWIGYGPNLWNLGMRAEYLSILPNPPAHAHSQVIQVLGMYGIFGLAAFAILALGLLRATLNGWGATHGAGFGMLLLLIGRSITEPAWFMESMTNSAVTLLGLFVVLAGAADASRRPEPLGDLDLNERPAALSIHGGRERTRQGAAHAKLPVG